jgi:CheY-like chemotaxis protein
MGFLGRVGLKSGVQPSSYSYSSNSSSKDPLVSQSIRYININSYSESVSPKEKIQINFEGGVNDDSKQVLVIDDNYDSAFTIKSCLESHFRQDTEGIESKSEFHPIQVTVYVDPLLALKEYKPYYYDLLLVDINMPSINGYELVEKIIKLDLNIKICFMSAGEINYEAIRGIRHPSKSFGCFIKKPASSTDLVNRVLQELY